MNDMDELKAFIKELLDHIDDHKEIYNKPKWTNEAIANVWVNTNNHRLKNFIAEPPSFRQKKMTEKIKEAKRLRNIGYSIREIMKIMNYKSPRSVQVLLEK